MLFQRPCWQRCGTTLPHTGRRNYVQGPRLKAPGAASTRVGHAAAISEALGIDAEDAEASSRPSNIELHGWPVPKSISFCQHESQYEVALSALPELYQEDGPLWALSNAAVLSRLQHALAHSAIPPVYLRHIDWEDIFEFLVSSAKNDQLVAKSLAKQVVRHLLCLSHAGPGDLRDNMNQWRREITAFRDSLADRTESKLVRAYLEKNLETIYKQARVLFQSHNLQFCSRPASTAADEGITLDKILERWWPPNVREELESPFEEAD